MKIGTQELIVVLIVVMIIFGPTQIPKLTKMFGKSVKSFREGIEDEDGGEEAPAEKNTKKKRKAEDHVDSHDNEES